MILLCYLLVSFLRNALRERSGESFFVGSPGQHVQVTRRLVMNPTWLENLKIQNKMIFVARSW
jgi:hypothetical protein